MRPDSSAVRAVAALALLGRNVPSVAAIDLDPSSTDSIKSTAKTIATELFGMYATTNGATTTVLSGIPGLLTYTNDQLGYYWWEAGSMFGQLIDYWYYTGDSQFNDAVKAGILFQVGDNQDLQPANQTKDEGNDDQLFWAYTVMSAAELKFPDPPSGKLGWLALAQSVMNQLIGRWDTSLCGGGLRWQFNTWSNGYNYKNTPSNGGMFHLGARLAKYTGNDTYAQWAEKAYDWMASGPLISSTYQVNDGTDATKGCVDADHTQWTYNYGMMIAGSAYMWNYTNGNTTWQTRLEGFLNNTQQFFPEQNGGAMTEFCEATNKCNVDQKSFKSNLARWLAVTVQLAPFTYDKIMPWLTTSAVAAAKQCNGGNSGTACGTKWWQSTYDGDGGVGQEMSAMSIVQSLMVPHVQAPFTASTGGTSQGDPGAGTEPFNPSTQIHENPITTADKAGAGILTAIALIGTISGAWWMIGGS